MRNLRAASAWWLLCAASVASGAPPDGMRGAHALLDAVPKAAPDTASVAREELLRKQADRSATGPLATDIAAFARNLPGDKNAAAHWTALFERWYALRHSSDVQRMYFAPDSLFAALPAPEHWPHIAVALRMSHAIKDGSEPTSSQLAVLAFADKLAGDTRTLKQRLTQFETVVRDDSKHAGEGSPWLDTGTASLEQMTFGADDDALKRFASKFRQHASFGEELQVPDLVTLAGEARAQELLLQALTESEMRLDVEVGDATRALAAKLALENIEKLRV